MKKVTYYELISEIKALIKNVPYSVANYANVSAAIFHALPDINWAGFYFLKGDTLILGPFQGKPARVSIALGHGVCGSSIKEKKSLIVKDVHAFRGHIACDTNSRSEIVIPLVKNGIPIEVLDIDSPIKNRFDEHDKTTIEEIASILIEHLPSDFSLPSAHRSS